MKMARLEKGFVNRKGKADRNITLVRQRLQQLDVRTIRNALELGCGIGSVSAFLADAYAMKVQGTDFDPEQIEIARSMHPEGERLRFSVEDAAHLTFQDGNFDLVLAQHMFHHVPDWKAAAREAARVLRPSGYLVWLDFAVPGVIKQAVAQLVKNYGAYTIEEIRCAFAESGLEQRFYERTAHGPLVKHHLVLQKHERELARGV
jgi:ubiquinone/menaquinone biosynthesis C-methylase UbiE